MAKNSDAPKKFGEGFDKSEFASPVVVGPAKGQEGWTPENPHVGSVCDPLGYLSEHK